VEEMIRLASSTTGLTIPPEPKESVGGDGDVTEPDG